MSWTEFKEKHLFSLNISLVASFILWQVRRDFTWHPVIIAWLVGGFLIPQLRSTEKKIMLALGKLNGFLILTIFYFVIFTPFAVLYRWFFRHESFTKRSSTFIEKKTISVFQQPF